jgi:hypothetical protein
MVETAEVEVVCPGMLEVLSVGKGDIKLTVGGDDPEEVDKGRKVIEEMLRKGYGIFVETDRGLTRVKKFNPKRMRPRCGPPDDQPLGCTALSDRARLRTTRDSGCQPWPLRGRFQ